MSDVVPLDVRKVVLMEGDEWGTWVERSALPPTHWLAPMKTHVVVPRLLWDMNMKALKELRAICGLHTTGYCIAQDALAEIEEVSDE